MEITRVLTVTNTKRRIFDASFKLQIVEAHDAFQGLGGEVRKESDFGLFGGMMVGRSKGEGR